jgi:SAM-dependent methyltransferase
VLVVGCGAAATLVRVAAAAPVALVGIDLLPEMLRVGRRRLRLTRLGRQAQLLRATALHLPFAAATFDRLYLESVLGFQDAASARRLLAEAHRVLRPGSLCAANEAVWKTGVTAARAAAIHAAAAADFGLGQASPQPWNVDDWRAEMAAAGFEILAADLLAERLARRAGAGGRVTWRVALSELLDGGYRLNGRLSPALRRRQAGYNARLAKHRGDGRHVEGRLFVLRKLQ